MQLESNRFKESLQNTRTPAAAECADIFGSSKRLKNLVKIKIIFLRPSYSDRSARFIQSFLCPGNKAND